MRNGGRMNRKKLLLGISLALLGAATIAGIASVLMPARFIDDDLIATAMIVGGYALGGLVLVSIGGTQRVLVRFCAATLALSMVAYISMIWADRFVSWKTRDAVLQWGTVSLMLGILLAHRILIVPLRAPNSVATISKRTALISAGILFVLLSYAITRQGFERYEEIAVRIVGVTAIVLVASTIAAGIIAMLAPKPGEDEPGLLEGTIGVDLTCPRCQLPIQARSNREARCDGCRLKVRVEVEEPRCACGYLLYQLESDTCPECGKPIDPDDRWQQPAPQPA